VTQALRVIEDAKTDLFFGDALLPNVSVEAVRRCREEIEKAARTTLNPKRKGGRPDMGREFAVLQSHRLLTKFNGGKPPTLTRGGAWAQVSCLLYRDDVEFYEIMKHMNKGPLREVDWKDPFYDAFRVQRKED
jgi:hypothetical protein